MNKLITYLLLLTSLNTLSAQVANDTAVTDKTQIIEEFINDSAVTTLPVIERAYTQRHFNPNFKDKYKTPEFSYETKARAKSLWDRFWEAVGKFFDRIFSTGNETTDSNTFSIFLRIIAFLVIGFVVYMIARIILNKEGIWIFGRSRKSINVQDVMTEDIHQMDFIQLTQSAKKTGDYRMAVRYYYLWLLKKFTDNEIIDWHWDKTNSDYLYEIKNNVLKKDFEYLSYIYDYSWYGDFPLNDESFEKAEKAFLKTLNTL